MSVRESEGWGREVRLLSVGFQGPMLSESGPPGALFYVRAECAVEKLPDSDFREVYRFQGDEHVMLSFT